MNKVYVIGRQTRDPETKSYNDASYVSFTVAADTRVKDKNNEGKCITNFYRCTAWRGLGDTCAKYLHKGDRVCVVGDLVFQTYTDTKGQERAAMQVTVTDVEFMSDKRSTESKPSQTSQSTHPAASQEEEDDLPFD